jgi:2-phosphosulfolactate phosphatase
MIFNQSEYDVRCEWGERGMETLAPASDVAIIVDVLSFSTSVEIATRQGAVVFPYRWHDGTAHEFAASVKAEVAGTGNRHGYSLSPTSLLHLPAGTRLVLASPNGSMVSLLAGTTRVIAGCLRNHRAVAAAAMQMGRKIAVIPAGERWADGQLRPCFEDFVGAGAIIHSLRGTRSPEASAAASAFESASENIFELLLNCASGKEKVSRDEENDVKLAAESGVSACVPLYQDGAFARLI